MSPRRSSSQQEQSKTSGVREFLAAWWRQPGIRLQLLFSGVLAYIVQLGGMVRLAVTLLVTLPLVTGPCGLEVAETWRRVVQFGRLPHASAQ